MAFEGFQICGVLPVGFEIRLLVLNDTTQVGNDRLVGVLDPIGAFLANSRCGGPEETEGQNYENGAFAERGKPGRKGMGTQGRLLLLRPPGMPVEVQAV